MKGAIIKPKREASALGMGQRGIAAMRDAQIIFRREEFVSDMVHHGLRKLPRHVMLKDVTARQLIVVRVRENIRDTIFVVILDVQTNP